MKGKSEEAQVIMPIELQNRLQDPFNIIIGPRSCDLRLSWRAREPVQRRTMLTRLPEGFSRYNCLVQSKVLISYQLTVPPATLDL